MVQNTFGIPEQHYTAIGEVAARWAVFEAMLDLTIWSMAGIERRKGACLTSQIAGTARKFDAILALLKDSSNEASKVKALNKLAEASHKLGERRNRVVHDPWIADGGRLVRLEASARKTLVYDVIPVDTAQLKKLTADIIIHTKEYIALMKAYLPEKSASLEKPGEA